MERGKSTSQDRTLITAGTLLVALCCAQPGVSDEPPAPRLNLRVLTVNLSCPLPGDCPPESLIGMAEAIRSYAADILFVREVFWDSVGESLIGAINSEPGYRLNDYRILPGSGPGLTGRGGTLIATTDLEISSETSHTFQTTELPDSFVNKGVVHLRVLLGTRNGQPLFLRVANTHLQSGRRDEPPFYERWAEVRRAQIQELRVYLAAVRPRPRVASVPLLLAGDFNVAQEGWAQDPETWSALSLAMRSVNLESAQELCGLAGEGSCSGSDIAATDFRQSVLQVFVTRPGATESKAAGYALVPVEYRSDYRPELTDHALTFLRFAYRETRRTRR